jgi:hypothetical protein
MKSLREWVKQKPLTRVQAIGWLVRLSKGLLVLHELDVAHGRVTANCVSSSSPKETARAMIEDSDEVARDFHFYSLDRIERTGASKDDDVWALGVLLYHLLTGGYPFPGDSRRKVGERIKWMPASPISAYGADHPDVQRLLDRLFKSDVSMRLVSLPLLVEALVTLAPETDALPPLELGVLVGRLSALPAESLSAGSLPAESGRTAQPAAKSKPEVVTRAARAPEASAHPPSAHPALAHPVPQPRAAKAERPAARAPQPAPDAEPSTPAVSSGSARSPAKPAPPVVPAVPPRSRWSGWLWVVVGAVIGVAGVAYVQYRMPDFLRADVPSPPSHPSPPPHASAPSRPAAPAAVSSTSAASSSGSAPPSVDVSACVASMFPDDTFASSPPPFDYVCEGNDPVAIAERLRGAVAEGTPAAGTITGAMRLWAGMGWFRMAFASAARQKCCEPPIVFSTELGGDRCGLDASLIRLGESVNQDDNESFRLALANYATSVHCLSDAPTAKTYGLNAPAGDGESSAFRVVVAKARAPFSED